MKLLSSLATWLGLALAGMLAGLKWWSLPCGTGWECGAVLHSRYGAWWGLPVGLYAIFVWLGAGYFPRRLRLLCLLALAAGSVWFVGVQAFGLRHFCPWCLAHAGATWAALAAWRTPPSRWAAPFGLLAAGLALVALFHVNGPAPAGDYSSLRDAGREAGQPWLGHLTPDGPVVVFSLTCPKCLELIGQVEQTDLSTRPEGPGVLLKTDEQNLELTIVFVAAVLAQGADRDAFLNVAAVLFSRDELVLGNPSGAADWLRGVFPAAAARRQEAEALVAAQHRALAGAKLPVVTPLLLRAGRGPATFFRVEEIFTDLPARPSGH